jgi:O-acetylserine/cysteine efflux transporter
MPSPRFAPIFVFIALLLSSALTWPAMKAGSEWISPLWFGFGRVAVAMSGIFLILAATRSLAWPKRGDLKLIVVGSTFQMTLFLVLAHLGIEHLHAGHANILCYATPLFVIPAGIAFHGEKLNRLKASGILLCLLGILVLFSPRNFDWSHGEAWIASGLLLLAAASWSVSILVVRHTPRVSPLPVVQAWQSLLACLLCLALALVFEPSAKMDWNPMTIGVLLFTGLVAGAFGQWAMTHVQCHLPSSISSTAFLAIPVFTLFTSAVLVGEPLTAAKVLAALLVIGGSLAVFLGEKRMPPPDSQNALRNHPVRDLNPDRQSQGDR